MKIITANNFSKRQLKEIKELYLEAFPKIERMPFWLIRLYKFNKKACLTGYYEDNVLCGISFSIKNNEAVSVAYLAVNPKLRGKGYGSKILQEIKKDAKNRIVFLEVEQLDDTADNAEQRRKRVKFYEKNGFYLSEYKMVTLGFVYSIMSTSEELSVPKYKRVIGEYFKSKYSPQLYKE